MRRNFYLTSPVALLSIMGVMIACSGTPHRQLALTDLRDSDGWYRFPDFRYRGPIVEGLASGDGVAEYRSGMVVRGQFQQGVLQGQAEVVVPGVGMIDGAFVDGRPVEGRAEYTNGDVYEGAFGDWAPSGRGLVVRANGERFGGTFVGGRPHGSGVFVSPTGVVTQGDFRNGLPDGPMLVTAPGSQAEIRSFRAGADRTREAAIEGVAAIVEAPERQQLDEARRVAERAARAEDQARAAAAQAEHVVSQAGLAEYNDACSCSTGRAVREEAGVVVYAPFCLVVPNRDISEAEARRIREQTRQRCSEWRARIGDPDLPAKIRAAQRELQARSESARQARARQQQAEAAVAQARREAENNAATQRVREARERYQADLRRRAEAARDRQRQFCTSNPTSCECVVFRPPQPGDRRGGARCA